MLAPLLLLLGCSDYEVVIHDGTDVFYQDPPSEVDILLVVDNSCSMSPYQTRLSKNFGEFISFFVEANVDYHVGVVTTDAAADSAGHILGDVITPSTPDGEATFEEIVSVGIEGSGSEMGIHAAWMALTEPRVSTTNAGFLRDTASLTLLFVSDEEDSSPLPTAEYINAFREVKGFRERDVFNASGLVVTNVDDCPSTASGSSVGDRYLDIIDETDGIAGSICEQSFSDTVSELSFRASRLMDTFYLSRTPNPASIEVSINEEAVGCEGGEWTYQLIADGDDLLPAVVFAREFMPEPSTQIAIRYDYGDGQVVEEGVDPAGPYCPPSAAAGEEG